MNNNRSIQRKSILWWTAAISLGISAAIYISLGEVAKVDPDIENTRLMITMIGIIITGICIIAATADRWFEQR